MLCSQVNGRLMLEKLLAKYAEDLNMTGEVGKLFLTIQQKEKTIEAFWERMHK